MSNVQDKNINKTQTDDFKQCGKIQLIFDQKLQPSKIKMSKKKRRKITFLLTKERQLKHDHRTECVDLSLF